MQNEALLPLAATFVLLAACALADTFHHRAASASSNADRRRLTHFHADDGMEEFEDDFIPGLVEPGDYSWTIARTIGVLTMQGGFALLEAGSVRPANRANIMMKNVVDMSIGLLLYAVFGYSIAFTDFHPFIGGGTRLLLLGAEGEYATVLWQFSFAATTGTIVSGVLAERVCFKAYVVLSAFIISFLYAVVAHWVWTTEGWLASLRFVDFAGAGVVHLLGGACAVTATIVVGPRAGRFGAKPELLLKLARWRDRVRFALFCCGGLRVARRGEASSTLEGSADPRCSSGTGAGALAADSTSRDASARRLGAKPRVTLRQKQIARHREAQDFRLNDPVNMIYGTFILVVGWLNFNCSGTLGLTHGREDLAARIGVVTIMGSAAGTAAGLLYSNVATCGRAFEIEPASVGALAGLVSITAGCANMGVWEGSFCAFVGGLLACASRQVLVYLQIDDPVGAIPVHFVGGVWGLLAVGFFNRDGGYGPSSLAGVAHGGGVHLLGVQLLGVLAIVAWGSVGTYCFMRIMRHFMSLRVSRDDEKLGLDIAEHGVGRTKSFPRPSRVVLRVSSRITSQLSRRHGAASSAASSAASGPTSGPTSGPASGAAVRRQQSCSAIGEFIEDVAHAANVTKIARRFAHNLRQRPLEAESRAPVGAGEIEVASSDELGGAMLVACAGSP